MNRFVILVIALSTSVSAAAASDDVGAVNTLVAALRAHVGRLERPLVTFRYSNDSDFRPRNIKDVETRLRGRPEIFFDPAQHGQMAGPGTYVAMDPVNSREYGTTSPQLFIITLKSDVRTLDLEAALTRAELARIRETNARLGCGARPTGLSDTIDTFRNSAKIECQQIAMATMRRLGVGAIVYNFVKPTAFPRCREGRDAAINVIDSGAIDFDRLEYYSDVDHFGASDLAPYTRRLYEISSADPFATIGKDPAIPKTLAGFLQTPKDFEDWKSRSIFGCGPVRSGEGDFANPNRMNAAIKRVFRDDELRRLFNRAREAFDGKIRGHRFGPNTPSFSLLNVRWALRLAYLAGSTSPNELGFENFQAARKALMELQALSADEHGELASLGRLLGEDESAARGLSSADLFRPSRAKSVQAWTAEFTAGLRAIGFGPRVTPLLASAIIDDAGGIVTLVKPLPNESETSVLARNRRMARHILTVCTRRYEDPDVSAETIMASWCGIDTTVDD